MAQTTMWSYLQVQKITFLWGGEGGLIHDVALTYFPVRATLSPSNDSRWCCIHMCFQGNGISVRDGWSLKMKFVDKHRMQQTKSSRPISECWYNLSRPQHPISCYTHASPICASLVRWRRRLFKIAPYGFEIILVAVSCYKILWKLKYFQMWVFIITSPHLIARVI